MKRGEAMKVVELKKVKLLVFFIVIGALLLFIYLSKRTRINEANQRRFKAMQDFMQNHENPKNMFDNQFGKFHRFRNQNLYRQQTQLEKVIDFTLSKEELNQKYEDNMKEGIDNEEVDFVPNKGQHFKKVEPVVNNNREIKVNGVGDGDAGNKDSADIIARKNSVNQKKKMKMANNIPVYEMPQRFPQNHNIKPFTTRTTTTKAQTDEIPKDYELNDKDVEGEAFSLIHNFLASKVIRQQATHRNLPTSVPEELYILNHNKLPSNPAKRPIIGNGYVGGVVRSEGVHMMGIYKGKRQHSRRAFIPSTFNHNYTLVFKEKELKMRVSYQIDMSTGIYTEIKRSARHILKLCTYAHRGIENLIVHEVDLKRSFEDDDVTVKVDLAKWTGTSDITFSHIDSYDAEVSYKVGQVNGEESSIVTMPNVHVMYDHVPEILKPSPSFRRTKWVFLTSYGTSEEQTKQAYEQGKKMLVGTDGLLKDHEEKWGVWWRKGRVDVEGNAHLSMSIYSSLYHLISNIPNRYSSSFNGLSQSGLAFGGSEYPQGSRVTFEQELSIFPSLLLLYSSASKYLLFSRRDTSQGAVNNALHISRRGAMFSVMAGLSGEELHEDINVTDSCPLTSALVSFALKQHLYVSHNVQQFNNTFHNLIYNLADYLHSRLHPSENGYHVKDQLVYDQSHGRIDDSPFGNVMISEGISFLHQLQSAENPSRTFFEAKTWMEDAKKIYFPTEKLIPSFKNYNFKDKLDEADVVMLVFPLNYNMSNQMKLANVDFYDQMTRPTSSFTSKAMTLISWLTLKKYQKANDILNIFLSLNNDHFKTWTPLGRDHKPQPCNLPAMGAFLQTILFGYLGLLIRNDRLDLNPSLPLDTTSFHVIGVDYKHHSFNILVEKNSISILVTTKLKGASNLIVHVYSNEQQFSLLKKQQTILPLTRVTILTKETAASFNERLT